MNKKYLAIIGGGIKQNKQGQWVSTDFTEPESFEGAPGGKIRVIAASILAQQNQELYIIATGGHGYDKNIQGIDHPGLANITQRELIELGVPQDRIIKETKSNNTYQQLVELSKIIHKHNIKDIAFISGGWHLPRIKAMIDYCPELKSLKEIKLISADDICLKNDRGKWQQVIDCGCQSKRFQKLNNLEKKGIQDIKQGKYKFK